MPPSDAGPLAQIVVAWHDDLRLTWSHIERVGRVSHTVLSLITAGTTRQPRRVTLDRIARGLATAPYQPHYRDVLLERRIRRELYLAAGYAPPSDDSDAESSLVETALASELGNREAARAWLAYIREHRRLGPDEICRLVVGPDPAAEGR
jgi:hypothetical protein